MFQVVIHNLEPIGDIPSTNQKYARQPNVAAFNNAKLIRERELHEQQVRKQKALQ